MLVSSNNEKISMYITGSAAVANIIANLILIPRYGFVGAAIATIITEVLLVIIDYIVVSRRVHTINVRSLVKPILAAGVMTAALLLLPRTILILDILIGGVIYAGVLLLVRGATKQDVQIIKNIFKRGETP